mmetsp:Transcript_31639/g.100888  ORF Transcript_31639/g.100888 Transcript_31639/m.100888 type:complete len:240 (-) Transcript_31639:284-1003(-)
MLRRPNGDGAGPLSDRQGRGGAGAPPPGEGRGQGALGAVPAGPLHAAPRGRGGGGLPPAAGEPRGPAGALRSRGRGREGAGVRGHLARPAGGAGDGGGEGLEASQAPHRGVQGLPGLLQLGCDIRPCGSAVLQVHAGGGAACEGRCGQGGVRAHAAVAAAEQPEGDLPPHCEGARARAELLGPGAVRHVLRPHHGIVLFALLQGDVSGRVLRCPRRPRGQRADAQRVAAAGAQEIGQAA